MFPVVERKGPFHQVIKRRPIHPITSKPEANTAWDPAGRFSALRVASDSDSAMVLAASSAAVNEFRRWYTRIISVRCSEAEGQRSSTYFPKDFKSPIAMLISLGRHCRRAPALFLQARPLFLSHWTLTCSLSQCSASASVPAFTGSLWQGKVVLVYSAGLTSKWPSLWSVGHVEVLFSKLTLSTCLSFTLLPSRACSPPSFRPSLLPYLPLLTLSSTQ
jgi:hypothetical protein